jgi:disulfide bond formation protein DsbB
VDHVNPTFAPTETQPADNRRSWLVLAAIGFAILMGAAIVLYWRAGRMKAA